MADESVENRDPESKQSSQAPDYGESMQPSRRVNRRRIVAASLLAAPVVMTLHARSARAQASDHPSMTYGNPKKKL